MEESTTTTAASTPASDDFKMSLPPRDVEEFDEALLKYCNAIVRLNDLKDSKEEIEMKKLLQELNNNLEIYLLNGKFNSFFMTALPIILQYLNCGSKNYIKEHNDSQIRQLVLELLARFPFSVTKNFLQQMFPVLYTIMEADNEENACIAFRILVDLHKRVQKLNDDIKKLLQLIKKFTCMLMQNAPKILEPYKPYHVRSMEELDLEPILQEIFVATSLQTETVNNCFTLLPRGINSLKLLTEVPINMILLSQIYRNLNEAENFELLQLALKLVVIQPTPEQKANEMFNLEIYTDFLAVQIKYFSFIAYMARTQEEKFQTLMVAERLPSMVLTFFKSLPDEMTNLRKDLLYSTRYIIGTRFRNYFAPHIEEFFDEDVIIGNGWATRETLRSFAYSIVYDLVHHLRDSLRLKEINLAINIYSKNLYDDSLSLTIHVMSCRLLLNIADSICRLVEKEKYINHSLLKIMEIFTNKISLMVKYSIPNIKTKLNNSTTKTLNNTSKTTTSEKTISITSTVDEAATDFNDNSANYKSNIEYLTSSFTDNEDYRLHFGIPEPQNCSINECRMLGRTLLNGLKILSAKMNDLSQRVEFAACQSGQFTLIKSGFCRPRDIHILIRLFKKGIKFLEIYNMNLFPNSLPHSSTLLNFLNRPQSSNNQTAQSLYARTKEEKEAIELFSSVFIALNPQTFRVVIESTIDYLVHCVHENCNLQQLVNFFLSNKNTSPVFADILTGYLVERMEVMGSNTEMSNLFLKLFKLVFGSVSLFQFENERMLQPHLRKLVSNSMKMAMNAQEPYNYFMLLRALFRSIGGGSHDQLYREFLPMLPSLLQGLNNFQTGIHRQNMKDLFVELCLTIPVRLSSLLPYLPWLMDPLVSALNGAPNLISQGLRTLELCVDNLQPDFLYAHFQPIRIELMQSLWRTLRYQNDNIAQISFRILGKLGGTNHRMMIEPQKLEYIEFRDSLLDENNGFDNARPTESNINIPSHGSCAYINIKFEESKTSIHLPVDKVIEAAYQSLRLSTTDPFYRQQCWQVVKGFLIANMQNFVCEEEKQQLRKLFSHSSFSTGTDFGYCSSNSLSLSSITFYKFPDEKLRKVHELALTAMLTASAIKELRDPVIKFMVPLVRHYTMVAICQQSGPINTSGRTVKLHGMDPLVLVDAMTAVMGQEEKELCKPCHLVLRVIIETTGSVLGSKERACKLPLYEYILERVCALCYERAWYSKYGGCVTVRYLFERMSLRWLFSHQFVILKAMLFVMMDLSGDLSSGVIEMAKDNLETMIKICGAAFPEQNTPKDLIDLQQKSMSDVVQELLRQITSSNTTVREHAMHLLEVLAKTSGCSVTDVIKPHKEMLEDMVPFKKQKLFQQPIKVQIGILDGNTFCITLEPQLFFIDVSVPEHLTFFNDVYSICENEDQTLQKFPCYKNSGSLTALRKAALRTLAACQNLKSMYNKIFSVLYKALISSDPELQECAYDCMNKYKYIKEVNQDLIRNTVRNFLYSISDIRVLSIKDHLLIQKLKNLARLFSYLFNDKLCELMFQHLNLITDLCFTWLRRCREKEYELKCNAQQEQQQVDMSKLNVIHLDNQIPSYLSMGVDIIYFFCEITAADASYVELFLNLLTKAESLLDIYICMTYYKPIQHFMKRYPKETIAQFEQRLNEESVFRFFLYVLSGGEESELFRSVLYENPSRLISLLQQPKAPSAATTPVETNSNASYISIGSQQSPQQVPAPASNIDVTSSPTSPSIYLSSNINTYQRYQAIKIFSILVKHDPNWLNTQTELVKALKTIWLTESFHAGHKENLIMESKQWEEPRLLVKCLLNYLSHNQMEFEMYFQLLRAFIRKYHCDFEFLLDFFANDIAKKFPIEWKRNAFLKFCELFQSSSTRCSGIDCSLEWSQELKAKILQYLIIPIFAHAFETGQNTEFLGPPLDDDSMMNQTADQSNPQPNLVSVFLNVLVKELTVSDSVRILVMQLGCLIVEHASNYIRPPQISENERVPRSKRQNAEVRLLMSYAWPGMHATKRQDSVKKYYCHLLLTHIISKISIHKKIIKQVFHNLLKGYYQESRAIVFNALEILIPVLPQRINDGYRMLRQLTKKLMIEESHVSAQLNHLLQIIVRYYRIYYPTRHIYVPHMVNAIQRYGLAHNFGIDSRKLALDLVEVIIRWEHERISSEQMDKSDKPADVDSSDSESSFDSKQEQHQNKSSSHSTGPSSQATQETQLSHGSIEKDYSDAILQFLIRFICLAPDFSISSSNVTQSNILPFNASVMPDFLCRRALALLKDALQNEFWPLTDIKLISLERILMTVKDNSPNYINICMALELLILFLQTLKRDVAIQMLMPLQRAISACCTCTNPKVVSTVHNLLTKLMAIVQPSCHSSTISPKSGQPVKVVSDTLETFEQLYTDIHSLILNGFMSYNKIGQSSGISGTPIIPGQVPAPNTAGGNINVQIMQNALNRPPGAQAAGTAISCINSTTTTLSQLFSVLMCLKAACLNEPMYIDRLSTPFSVMLQKLVKEHITSVSIQTPDFNVSLCADIINLCLELIKNRIGALNPETRRTLINSVFLQLIEKSPEVKVIKTLLKIFEEWIKQPLSGATHGSRASSSNIQTIVPVLRDKTTLVLRVGQNIEKRFPDDLELNAQYLELIHYIYSDDTLKSSDMAAKLEFAFMSGLRCSQPHIRQKFFNLLDSNLRKRLYDRLTYIVTAQNWETIGMQYWIKQIIELILSISSTNEIISTSNQNAKLPLPISLIPLSDHQEKSLLTSFVSNGLDSIACTPTDMLMNMDLMSYSTTNNNVEMMDISEGRSNGPSKKQDENLVNDIFHEQASSSSSQNNNTLASNITEPKQNTSDPKQNLLDIVCSFLEQNRNSKSWLFFNAVAQLCHLDNRLAHHIWIQLFPRIYSILNERQQMMIASELAPFFSSGIHSYQREMPISSVNTFFEAVSHCDPPIKFRPAILRYLSKNHNVWHRACLLLEADIDGSNSNRPAIGIGGLITNDMNHSNLSLNPSAQKHTRSLGSSQINGVGDKHSGVCGISPLATNISDLFPSELPASLCQPYTHECMSALAHIYETLKEHDYWNGIWHKRANYKETLIAIAYEQQGFFEQAKGAYELAMSKGSNEYSTVPIPYWLQDEYALWELHWIRCSKELNQWDFLLEYGSTPELANPLLVLESAWRIPDWNAMNQAVSLVEQNLPKDFAWKLALYKGYNALCNSNHRDMEAAERMVEVAASFLLKDWRKLPNIVSLAHISILQGAHQVIELQEAYNLHHLLFSQPGAYGHERPCYDLKSLIKTWKNRLPIVADDLSHWSDIFTWRQHHYQTIVSRFESEVKLQQQGNNISSVPSNAMCGVHASAQSLIHLAKVARKHFLINVALDQLNRIHTIPKVPIVDCFQKIRQQLKCYLLKHSLQLTGEELQEAMSVIDCTHLHFFQSDMMAEFIALKGYVLMKMKRMDEANKNLSTSLQIVDTMVKSWAMWAEFNYEMFISSVQESFAQRNIQHGVNAIISFLHAARHQNEAKARKYLSYVLWLLSYDKDQKFAHTIEQYNTGVPPSNWVPWIQQLLYCLVRSEGQMVLSIISQISKLYPEAVYFPTRVLYLTLKLEQREMKYKFSVIFSSAAGNHQQNNNNPQSTDQVQASSGMWRCTRIMHHQRELHPTLLTSIEGILDQMSWFRENWFEEILRQLRQALAKCYAIAFENRNNVAETITSYHFLNYIRKLVNTFGIGIDNATCGQSSSNTSNGNYSSSTSINVNDPNQFNQNTSKQGMRTTNLNTTASETLARRAQSTVQDPDFQKMKQQFANDFDFSIQGSRKLHNLIVKLKKWIKILEAKTKLLPKSWLLEEKCRYLSNFSQQIAEVALPGEYFLPKSNIMCIINIARFMPRVEIITKHNTTARRLYIRGHNGKIYPYLVLNDSSLIEVRREERFLHLLRLLNLYLTKHKETARRVINFTVPRVVPIAGQMRFVEDNVSSLSLIEIYKQHMIRRGSDPDAPIAKYYDRLLSLQTKGSQVSLSQLKDIIFDIQSSMAPKTLLKEWALQTFSTATEFWHFRKLFTLQLGLAGLSEFAFHLTRLNPDMMYIHRDSGLVNIAYYRFDLSEETGELMSNQPVPFRMTHSVQNLITEIGIHGPLTATMIATASCLVHPNYKVRSILLAIFRDEIINWYKRIKSNEKMALISAAMNAVANNQSDKNVESTIKEESGVESSSDQHHQQQQFTQQQQLAEVINSPNINEIPEIGGEELVTLVTKAVNAIMSRLQSLATFDGTESNVATLINAAINPDNLCRMDPAWHPWL